MDISDLLNNTKAIVGIIGGVIAIISVLFPGTRRCIGRLYARFTAWKNADVIRRYEEGKKRQDELSDQITSLTKLVAGLSEQITVASKAAKDNGIAIEALKMIVTNGLSHGVATLTAQHKQSFEAEMKPKFICDETGANGLVSYGYLKIIGCMRSELEGDRWHSALGGDLKDKYMEAFNHAVEHKTSFAGTVDFVHPVTGRHRGRWRVATDCTPVGEALIYTGRFILAVDDKAREIAADLGLHKLIQEEE